MKSLVAAVTLILLFTLTVFAQDRFPIPEQTIIGAGKVGPGEMVSLSVSEIPSKPDTLQNVIYNWTILDEGKIKTTGIIEWPDKTKLIFSPGISKNDKRYTIILNANYLFVVKDGPTVKEVATRAKVILAEVTVSGFNPGPGPGPDPIPPGPGPGPGPDPILPDGKYNLSRFAYDNRNLVEQPYRAKGAKVLSASFSGIASSIASGSLSKLDDILAKTTASNNTTLTSIGIPLNKWEPWAEKLQAKLYDLYRSKQLATPTDFATAWREVSTGLDAIKE
jgi:hypothetical protein